MEISGTDFVSLHYKSQKMSAILKKVIYTSLGVASVAQDKLKELVEDLIQNDHYTEEEGKRIVDTFLMDLRAQVDMVHGNVQHKVDEILAKAGITNLQQLKDELSNYFRDVKENPAHITRLPTLKQ
jgi:polyhydroxyalkanoate synthesis regulator phasin